VVLATSTEATELGDRARHGIAHLELFLLHASPPALIVP
jgi:hypothetical protein